MATFVEYVILPKDPTGPCGPWGIIKGPDNNLWFTLQSANEIGRITTSGTITLFQFPQTKGPAPTPEGITAGPSGDAHLWFTLPGVNAIGSITTSGTITIREFSIPTLNSAPWGITAGPNGLWFTERDGNRIGIITTSGTIHEFPIPTPNSARGHHLESGASWRWQPLVHRECWEQDRAHHDQRHHYRVSNSHPQ